MAQVLLVDDSIMVQQVVKSIMEAKGHRLFVSGTVRNAMSMIHAGHAEFTPNGIRVSYENPAGAPITNAFKDSYVAHFKSQGNTVVFVGDGLSDLGPARLADHVIARDGLADDMERLGLPYSRFETFRDVGEHVERIRKNLEDNDSNR